MKYNLELTSFYELDYFSLENMIEECYGREYEIPCNEECGNDQALTFNVDGKQSEYDLEDMERWINGKQSSYMLQRILDDMAAKEWIPKGKYVVEVSW